MLQKPRILIGTSGYSYNDWIGPIYPKGTKQSDFLRVYSSEFSMTELNFTYYRQPEVSITSKMATIVPEDFLFAVKGHKTLTHEVDQSKMLSEAAIFMAGIEPFIDAGKLGTILFQFPTSFHYNRDNRKYLDDLCAEFRELPLAIEFRNEFWQKESVYKGLSDRKIAMVNVDEPQLPRLLKPSEIVTAPLAYVRFHGRNKENWWSGDNVTRYDYLYNDNELQEWVPRIIRMVQQAGIIMLVFNNHSKGQAVQNARRLKELLELSIQNTEARSQK